jgi:hypothetical protein
MTSKMCDGLQISEVKRRIQFLYVIELAQFESPRTFPQGLYFTVT